MADQTTPVPEASPSTVPPGMPSTVVPADDTSMKSFKDVDDFLDSGGSFEPKEPVKETVPDEDSEDDGDLEDDDTEDGTESDDEHAGEGTDEESSDDDSSDDGEATTDDFFDKDGKATFKVNGQIQKYTKDQIRSIIASGAHTLEYRQRAEREIGEAKRIINQRHAELNAINEAITPVWEAIKNNKFEEAFLELASMRGQSRLEAKRALREAYIPVVAEYLGISKDWVEQRLANPELRAYHEHLRTKEENQFLKEEAERAKRKAPPPPRIDSPGVAAIKRLQAQRGIPDAKIAQAIELAKQSGEITGREPDVPVGVLVNKLNLINACDRAVDAILALKPSLAENSKFVDQIVAELRKKPDMDGVELGRLVRKRAKKLAQAEADALTREVSRKSLRGKDQSVMQAPNKAMPARRVMSFRDLPGDELM